jgi:2-iminobutanoate/2-iminopropanoate deaminase
MQHQTIVTTDAPTPKRHFSQGSLFGGLIFTSGQGPVDPATGTITSSDIAEQTRQTLRNLAAILAAGGSSLANVLKVNVYLRRMEDIAQVDEVFRELFTGPPPPRATIGAVLGTPGTADKPGMDIEIEMVAYVPDREA